MLLPFYKVFALLDRRERRQAVLLLCMILVMGVIETVGLTSIMPLIAVLTNPDVIANNRFLNVVYVGLGYTSIDDFTFSLAIAAFVLLIGGTAFKALTTWALTRFAYMRRHSLACRLIGGYMNQPYEWFLNRHSADLAKNALSEVDLLVAHALLPAMRLLSNCTVVFFLFVLLVAVEPLLAIGVTVVISGVYGCIYFASARYLGSVGAERLSTNNQRYKVAQEALSAIKDVKVAGLEDAFLTRFKVPSKRFAETLTNFQLVGQLPRYAMEAIIFGGLLLVVLYSMSSVGGFQEILPILALYTLAAYRLIPTLQAIYNDLTQIRFSEPALESLDRDLRELPSQHAATEPLAARPISPECSQSIRLQQIKYTYPATHREALAGVDVDISACTTVGFVGTTGSGKTTCVDIILGLLTPESGELWVGGELLTKDKLRSWQQNIGYVPQSANLVDDTVSANIAFGVQSHMVKIGRAHV